MRISVDTDDPGYINYLNLYARGEGIEIFLDGERMDGVVTADDEIGVIVRYKRDGEGHYQVDEFRGEAVKEDVFGDVKIVTLHPPLSAQASP